MKNKFIKTKNIILFSFIFLLFISLVLTNFTKADTTTTTSTCPPGTYYFETGVPFFAKQGECKSSSGLQNMISSLIKKLFPIAGILAFAMIVFAGFEYATSGGDTSRQKDAQDRIANAIIGLILLFAFWIIIYTINPDILRTQNIEITPITTPITIETNMQKLNDYNIPLSYELLQGFAYADNDLGDLLHTLFMNTYYTKNQDGIYEAKASPIEWYLTEACITNTLPCQTTYAGHTDTCHYNGTCVDLVLKNPTDDNKSEFIKIATKIGLNIYNEYTTACTTPGTTGFHFHVALECKTGSCWYCAK